jgi:TolA-binding protein
MSALSWIGPAGRRGALAGLATLAAPAALATLLSIAPARAAQPQGPIPAEDVLWRQAGEAFAAGKDKSAAMQQYRLFVTTYKGSPRAASAQYMLAECYFAIGDWEAALKEFERVDGFKGRDAHLQASVLLRSGECLFNLKRFPESIAAWTRLIDEHEHTFLLAESLYEVGQAYIVEDNWLRLEAAYRRLLEARPGYKDLPQVHFALGIFAYHNKAYDEALKHFESVPTDRGLYYMGRCLEDTGQYILAIQRYKQVLRQYPESSLADDAAFSVAEAFYRSGQNAVAVSSYKEFIERYVDSPFVPNARYKMACVTYNDGHYDESIRQLTEICDAFAKEPVCAYASYLIGSCNIALGRSADAIFAWTRVVREFADSQVASAALHKIVFAYAQDGNYAQAIQMAQEFLRRYPGDVLAARVLVLEGFCHTELGEHDQAVLAFQNVLDKHVNTDVAERALFLSTLAYYQRGQYDRLITNYHYIAKRLLPTPSQWRARTYYYLGEAYYAQGLYQEAGGMYRLVLTGYPKSNVAAPALQGLVASLSQAGDYELALKEQERFLLALANSDSDGGTNALAVGSIYFNQHKYEEALAQFTEFLKKNPDSPDAPKAMANLGMACYRLQYYDQALATWRDLLARFPKAPEAEDALYHIADTQFGLGRFADARATYQQLSFGWPKGAHAADACFGTANCAYNLKEDDAAIAAFNAFLAAYPNDPRAQDAELGVQSCYYRSGKDMEQYLARRPDSPLAADVYWSKGQESFAKGDYATAARFFEKVTLDYPGSESGPGALFYLAESYYKQDQLEPALAGYRNFISTHKDHELAELAHFREGTVLFKLERFGQAAQSFETLADLYPKGQYAPLAVYNAALAYQQVEDWTSAIGGFLRVLADYPEHEKAKGLWLQVGALYQDELGDYPRAIEAYDKALAQDPGQLLQIRFKQGECWEKQEKLDDALRVYEQGAGSGAAADPYRIASLAQIGRILEARRDWAGATNAYQRIIDAHGKPEWTEMAQGRITAIKDQQVAGN